MRLWWLVLTVLVSGVAGKGKKHKHQKPGRAVLDRLSSTTISEPAVTSDAFSGLLPAPLDAAPFSTIEASATCGENGVEEYCREMPGKRGIVCGECAGPSAPARHHPAARAFDPDPATWWQSPTLASGEEYKHVDLVVTMPAAMELLHVIIKSGPSPRPLAWSLEVSTTDADDWRLIRAFGDKEHCRKLWDLRPERRRRKARGAGGARGRTSRADKPTCSTQFTSPRPLENGEMHVALGSGVIAHRVRISFRAAHSAPEQRQYYTVRSLTLAARCLCHGHADSCHVSSEGAECVCQDGTCGSHCERCCSGNCDVIAAVDDVIVSVNCTDNRAGPLCDRCLDGFYTITSDGPCIPCDCNPDGSDGTCIYNATLHKASCNCLARVTGSSCDACARASAVFPGCDVSSCDCDPRGILDPDRACDDVCVCKANVIGAKCDTCAPGHFGLSADLPAGCRKCYCSYVADTCVEQTDVTPQYTFPMGENVWLVSDLLGNQTLAPSVDDDGKPYLISYEVEGWDTFYWSTSVPLLTSRYGSSLRAQAHWSVVRGDTGGSPTHEPDFFLLTADGTTLASLPTTHDTPGRVDLEASLTEDAWRPVGPEGSDLDRTQFMAALVHVKAVLIRAHFHWDQDEVRLISVEIPPSPPHVLEKCACPRGHAGAHCGECAFAHWRVAHTDGRVECAPCACHGHADCKDAESPCGPCQHNTTGPHCERCLPGHYGNPVQGGCKPCACPLFIPSNNFSPLCALASADGDDYVCTQCPEGYTGDKCEFCDYGYWGSPSTAGGACNPCECGGAPCDPHTGKCLACPKHTEGENCIQCQEGYYVANVTEAGVTCAPCACPGAAPACRCACPAGRRGTCRLCEPGRGGIDLGCPLCKCGTGALNNVCDVITGACVCAPGAQPPYCDQCLPEHYGLDVTGCLGCNCSSFGSESNVCDIRSGQCRCKPHVTGRACDTCEEGYYGLTPTGCRQCSCGAGAAACDPATGACACARGVTGHHCDACLPGYYGFGASGCLPCPKCEDGKICDAETGRCVCPPRSLGAKCSTCAKGYYGKGPNCQPCDCGTGAVSPTCHPVSGACACRSGWAGRACDTCGAGHAGPRCAPCACDAAGARASCPLEGRCLCKENVEGEKCDRCKDGTFGLSAHNPHGCTACFCFGRSARCSQAQLSRARLRAPGVRHLTLKATDAIHKLEQESLISIHTHAPDATIAMPQPPVPVYIELDKRFLGDKLTSYGGTLQFKVEEEGGEELPEEVLSQFPLVRIYGRQDISLDYFQHEPPVNGTHTVPLHESEWRGASRPLLMTVLQRVTRVLLRATTRAPTAQDFVHALILNVSLETTIPGHPYSAPALGVELCSCPRGYSGLSCSNPAVGFWMPPQTFHLQEVQGTIVIAVDGDVKPCHCNGRAVECDSLTGHCLNCREGTGGPHCAQCAAGHHGSPVRGCRPCPCPHETRNYAAACHLSAGDLRCLCKPGYTGPQCESCAPGYHRERQRSPGGEGGGEGEGEEEGACVPCACDAAGAVSQSCDARGLCQCRPFALGDKCHRCVAPRSHMAEGGCLACDNCTQTLLNSIEQLTSDLHTKASINELSRIPKPFPAVRQFAHNTSQLRSELHELRNFRESSRMLENDVEALSAQTQRVLDNVTKQTQQAFMNEVAANSLGLESMTGLEEVLTQRRKLAEQVQLLEEFAKGERHLSAHRALKEATRLLRTVKDVRLIDYIVAANDVFDKATLQSTSIQEHNYQISSLAARARSTQSALAHWSAAADDVPRLADRVWDAGDEVAAVGRRVKPKLVEIRDLGLRCRLMLEDVSTAPINNLTSETREALAQSQSLTTSLPELVSELATLAAAAEEKEGILYSLTPAYRSKYLTKVQKHVDELGRKSGEYKSLFAGTRSLASAGMEASRAWAEVTSALHSASTAASAALARAVRANKLARGAKPMVQAAKKANDESMRLMKMGEDVLKRAGELSTRISSITRTLERVSMWVRSLGWQERALSRGTPDRDAGEDAAGLGAEAGGGMAALRPAAAAASRVHLAATTLHDEAAEIRRKSRYNLRRQLAELQKHGDSQLGAAQEHVSQIRGNTYRATEMSDALSAAAAARAREHSAADVRLRPSADELRRKIARARHAAQTIAVSLTSSPQSTGCARAYLIPSFPSSISRLSLALSFDTAVKDGTIFHLASTDEGAFLTLYVNGGRLILAWNLGDDDGRIEYGEKLEATHDDVDHTSYRIEVERIWNTMKLTVERSGSSPLTLTNSTSPSHIIFRPSRLWLGSPRLSSETSRLSSEPARLSSALPVCAHALFYDDRRLGLWDFVEQPKEAKCSGCTQRWYTAPRAGGEPSLAWFNGEGYSSLRRSFRPAAHRAFSLALVFRTRDEDALLFMARDLANNRSVSVVMRSCRVVFLVEYGASTLQIVAPGRHCHGRAVHVQAIRVFGNRLEKGSLRVNGEETLGSPEPPVQEPAALPDLSAAEYWVGGAPPHAGSDLAPPLLGCLGALTVDREGYDPLDTPARSGVEPACGTRTLRSLTSEGNGYVELPCPPLRRKSALGLSFLARQPAGLLLHRPASDHPDEENLDNDTHYLTIALVDGLLEVVISAGKAELRLRSNGTRLDDGRMHTLRLLRLHKQLELWIDSALVASGPLSGNALPSRPRGLFLAGTPGGKEKGFTGTIADLIVDGVLIGVETGVSWSSVRLGRADQEPRAQAHAEPTALHAEPDKLTLCTKSPSFTVEAGAAKFGDSPRSHATLRLRRARDVTVQLQIRTYRTWGLLLLAPGSKSKPRHYFALILKEGKPTLILRGRRRRELILHTDVSHGQWTTITLRVSPSRASLTSGGISAQTRAPRRLALGSRLYVGGAPPAPPSLPPSMSRVGGLVGCVRRVSVGGRAQDLVRDVAAHHRVRQCYPAVQPGAHFAGDAHAVWSSAWAGGAGGGGAERGADSNLELRLQFRTAEPSGLLVATRNFLLELQDGAVIITRRSPTGEEISKVQTPGSGQSLCDDNWHAIVARISSAVVTISLDGGPELRGDSPGLLDEVTESPVMTSPLYIGGLPEGVPDNIGNGKENFRGCIRDVTVAGEKRDWTVMETLHNVLIDSCPVAE